MFTAFELPHLLRVVMMAMPVLLVAVPAVVLCMVRESLPRRVRVAVACAVVLQVTNHLVTPLITYQISRFASTDTSMNLYLLVNVSRATAHGIVLALLVYAAFAGRGESVSRTLSQPGGRGGFADR